MTVLVTGGTRGIGLGIARAFADAGHDVAVCGRTEVDGLDLPFFQGDVRDLEQVDRIVSGVIERFGSLDVLVNNAGGSPPADSATVSPRFSEAIIRLNLIAPLNMCQRANTQMQQQESGGVILNICSVSGLRGSPMTAAYGASKAGLLNLTRTLAIEWAPKVRVNAITPGLVDTGNAAEHYPAFDAIAATVPLGRFGTPADISGACVFLASEKAAYISGANLVIDGGGEWPAFLRPDG